MELTQKKKKIQKLLPVAAQKNRAFLFFIFLTVLIIAVEMQVNDY